MHVVGCAARGGVNRFTTGWWEMPHPPRLDGRAAGMAMGYSAHKVRFEAHLALYDRKISLIGVENLSERSFRFIGRLRPQGQRRAR
jgi:hypothetical protein